jgi:hypothetical protein
MKKFFWVFSLIILGLSFHHPALGATLVSDDFEAYSTFPSGNWSNSTANGNWSIISDGTKVARQGSTGSSTYIVTNGNTGWANYTYSVKVKVYDSSIRAGLVARYLDNNNYYALYLYNGRLYLDRRKNSSTSNLKYAAYSYNYSSYYTVKIELNGTNIKGYVNNTLLMDLTNSDLTAGKLGFYNTKGLAWFDDVTATDATGGTPTPTPTSSSTPTPVQSSTPTPTPPVSPTPTPSSSATPTPTPTPTSTPTPTPSTGKPCDAGLTEAFQTPDPVTGRTVNILSYGATANNSSDDDAGAINAAIAAAQYGDEVLIPNGTFHIKTRKIKLKSGVSLRGETKTGAILAAQFNSVSENQGSYLLQAEPGVHDLTLSNFTITSTGGQELNYAIFLGVETGANVYRIAVQETIIEKFAKNGVGVRNGNFILIKNNLIREATQTGGGGYGYGVMLGYSNTYNCWVSNNYIGPGIRHAVLIQYYSHHNLVDYNTADSTTEDSYDLHGEDEYSNELCYNKAFNGSASGIGIGNTGGSPEHYNAGPNNWIHHNEVWNCEHGFNLFRESHSQWIEDNYFHDCSDEGMYIYNEGGNYVTIRRNRSQNNASGARFDNAQYLVLEANIITDNTGFAMKTNTGTIYYLIRNNDFRNNGSRVELGSTNGTYINNLE